MSERKTVALTTSFRLQPALDNLVWMFARTFWVWAFNPDGVVPVFGSVPTCPDTNTNGPATTAPEKGNVPGFGGSIRSIMVSPAVSARTTKNRETCLPHRNSSQSLPLYHGEVAVPPQKRVTRSAAVAAASRNASWAIPGTPHARNRTSRVSEITLLASASRYG